MLAFSPALELMRESPLCTECIGAVIARKVPIKNLKRGDMAQAGGTQHHDDAHVGARAGRGALNAPDIVEIARPKSAKPMNIGMNS